MELIDLPGMCWGADFRPLGLPHLSALPDLPDLLGLSIIVSNHCGTSLKSNTAEFELKMCDPASRGSKLIGTPQTYRLGGGPDKFQQSGEIRGRSG